MTRAEQVKEASVVTIGGSEDDAKERVKQLFKKDTSDPYKNLSACEIKQHELEHWLEWIVENNKRFEGRN